VVPGDELGRGGGESADQFISSAGPHLRNDRQYLAVCSAQPLHERAVEVRDRLAGYLAYPAPLLVGGLVGQRHTEPCRRLADLSVEIGMLSCDEPTHFPHSRTAAPLLGLLPSRSFPQAGLPHLDQQIPIGRTERAPLGLRPAVVRRCGGCGNGGSPVLRPAPVLEHGDRECGDHS
jgi:hypothetical protein